MRKFFLRCFDALFPPREKTLIVRSLTSEIVDTLYRHTNFEGIEVLSDFSSMYIRALIHEAKFHQSGRSWQLLHRLVLRYVQKRSDGGTIVLVPIPLARARLRARGYNQVTQIIKCGPMPKHVIIKTNVLRRIRDTKPQTTLKRSDRLDNMRDAFGVAHGEKITGKHVIIIDDVATTGATLRAAKAAMEKHKPASIILLALAH